MKTKDRPIIGKIYAAWRKWDSDKDEVEPEVTEDEMGVVYQYPETDDLDLHFDKFPSSCRVIVRRTKFDLNNG